MMYNYPFYSFSKRYTRYPSYSYAQSRSKNYPQFDGVLPPSFPQNPQREGSSEQSNFNRNIKKEPQKEDDTDTLFEIFGIKLHSDDLLLICLIFFLYKEGVQDQYLFIALILLLLS